MIFIDLNGRDILSIIADIGGLIGWGTLGFLIIKKHKLEIKSSQNQFSSEKDQYIEEKKNIFWGAYINESIIKNKGRVDKQNSSEKVKTIEEIKKEI